MSDLPRISFGMIVLNGEPFLRYNLRALYPFAHEIIVVEGAVPAARHIASADGHSRDSTLQALRDFQASEDPQGKLRIITRDGFWSEKDAMSQAYAAQATGDYLWQVDVDEFYQPADMRAVCALLRDEPAIGAVSFNTLTFWGAPQYRVDSWYKRRGAKEYHRLFKWGAGYQYTTHRPPTVLDAQGRDLRARPWIRGDKLAARGIFLYHYSLLLPRQVREKCDYYSRADWAKRADARRWAEEAWFGLRRPYHAHNVADYPGCLYRYTGKHPPQMQAMWRDLCADESGEELRRADDIEALLSSRTYQLGRALVMRADRPALWRRTGWMRLTGWLARRLPDAVKRRLRRATHH
ncbi:MAG: glycosyltransferase family A protein [Chloroflexi bacterium]|nr:glycosyltransferase family A protein [Chloroflexota bacterium]MCY3583001.1 glycosyltransferase family A protein [Chloroflexota bacterium]MCY3716905.1 glycosyltransferase family A protein [Chloroflexota bacterium]MDE2650119.1 glycosyltransferase family A protein [Chloroflexota bacterium]MXV92908.1 glycosyltransferase family 2 protein [Chloroflexota bacterium]